MNPVWLHQLLNVVCALLFLRFMIQVAGVSSHNPVTIFTMRATKLADVFERILPTLAQGRFHLAALILIVLVRLVDISSSNILTENGVANPITLIMATVLTLVRDFLICCRFIIIGAIILSWVLALTQLRSPFFDVVIQISDFFCAPIRRLLPDTGPIDFSAMIAYIIVMVSYSAVDRYIMQMQL